VTYTPRKSLPHIYTFWRKKYYFGWPLAEEISIEDIANSLSNICRFTGHCSKFYSVAEHSVRVSYLCSPENQLRALLHDSAEAFLGDISRPLKHSVGMETYRIYERQGLDAIMEHFELPFEEPAEVKDADNRLLITEQRDLLWGEPFMDIEPLPEKIVPWTPEEAKRIFLMRFYELTNTRTFYRLSTRGAA
jgi:5'-deoxynucleotidase YfbR-like HD superfamily hydrolase